MESYYLAQQIQALCRRIINTDDPELLQSLCKQLRALLHEQTRQTSDIASETLAQILEMEDRHKNAI